MKVLIVEDNASVSSFMAGAATEAGYDTTCVFDGDEALKLVASTTYDLIVLDVMLPNSNGFDLTRQWRTGGVRSPILIVTARDSLEDKLEGLDAGADDYICKPFQMAELLARMRALLRRIAPLPAILTLADLTLDSDQRIATRGNTTIRLSTTEYTLLEFLLRHADRVVARSEILHHVWQYDFGGYDNVLDVYISYLRRKIDKGRVPLIHTVRGQGFQMRLPDAA